MAGPAAVFVGAAFADDERAERADSSSARGCFIGGTVKLPVGAARIPPEVVQTSRLDCGPAALSSMLSGFGIHVSQTRLRNVLNTDVDGTSLKDVAGVGAALGLRMKQVGLPADLLLSLEGRSLPAIVTLRLPDGAQHFVVAWRVRGERVLVMDPGAGTSWRSRDELVSAAVVHEHRVPGEQWLAWARGEQVERMLRSQWKQLRLSTAYREQLLASRAHADVPRLAAMLNATRFATALRTHGDEPADDASFLALSATIEAEFVSGVPCSLPSRFVVAQPGPDGRVITRGTPAAVCLGRQASMQGSSDDELPAAVRALREEHTPTPWRALYTLLKEVDGGRSTFAVTAVVTVVAAVAATLETVGMIALLDLQSSQLLPEQKLAAAAAFITFSLTLLLIDLGQNALVFRLARQLELRVRRSILERLPRLKDRELGSRPLSDLADRAHQLHDAGRGPGVVLGVLRVAVDLVVSTGLVLVLLPQVAPVIVLATFASVAANVAAARLLAERSLRLLTWDGALSRFFLDALRGASPARAHGAAEAVLNEHEALLVPWVRGAHARQDLFTALRGVEALTSAAIYAAAIQAFVGEHPDGRGLLFFMMAVQRLGPTTAGLLAALQAVPITQAALTRVLAPLEMEVEPPLTDERLGIGAASIQFDGVTVSYGSTVILDNVSLTLRAGEHVAVVGSSGSGKSTLVGACLGLVPIADGRILVDGQPATDETCVELRRDCLWVDPQLSLFRRSLLHNVALSSSALSVDIPQVLADAELEELTAQLPAGLSSSIGDGGGLLSGGEGQRVRIARGLARRHSRLVLLDEAFRGLDRPARTRLLHHVRTRAQNSTLVAVTHDVSAAWGFERVVVLHNGRVVADGKPGDLAADATSPFAVLLAAERDVDALWADPTFKRLELRAGRVST